MEEYSLNFTILPKYAPYLVSNPRYEMSRFVIGVAYLVKEEYRTTMLHYCMTLARLILYAQLIKESKLKRMSINLNMIGKSEKDQCRFKKRAQIQYGPSDHKAKL